MTIASGLRDRRRRATGRVRPVWKAHQPTVLALFAVVILGLGYIGFQRYRPVELSWTDSLYGALQLFGMESPQPPVPWQLDVARLVAPLIVGYAALRTLASIFRDQFELFSVRLLRGHVIITGLSNAGFRLAVALYDAGHRVAVVERDAANPLIPGCRERDIRVVHGDATDPEVLRRVGVQRAAFLLVTCGDDATNIDVAAESRRLSAGRNRVVTAHVHLADPSLAPLLQADALTSGGSRTGMRLQFFNLFEVAARALLDRFPPPAQANQTPPRILLAGLSGPGTSLALLLARRSISDPTGNPTLLLAGPNADHDRETLVGNHPGIERLLDLRTIAVRDPASFSEVPLNGDTGPVSVAYVCLGGETEALAASLALAQRDDVHGPVVLVVDDADAGVAAAVRTSRGMLARVHPFGIFNAALRADLLRGGTTELLARAKHEHYVECERERGVTVTSNDSMVAWEDLSETVRESNRCFADGVGDKLEALGLVLIPAPLDGAPVYELNLSEADLDDLAMKEHARWADDLRREGWTPTDGPKDPTHKRHPLLAIRWAELPEAERDKDRDPIRALPELLRRAGLAAVSTAAEPPHSTGPSTISP